MGDKLVGELSLCPSEDAAKGVGAVRIPTMSSEEIEVVLEMSSSDEVDTWRSWTGSMCGVELLVEAESWRSGFNQRKKKL